MPDSVKALIESDEPERLATGFEFTEGPLWHPDGYWLFVDLRRSRIYRLPPGGDVETFREDSGTSNGLTFDLQRRLIMCESDRRRVARMEPDGAIAPIAERYQGLRLNRPNDVVCTSDGSIYFTDPNGRLPAEERELDFAGVLRVRPDGDVQAVATEMENPNGLAFSPDERTLYVANTRSAQYIAAYDVRPDGSLDNRRVFVEMPADRPGVPDGMKVDLEGRVYCTGPGGCWVLEPSGEHIGTIELPEQPANLAWGGADYRTLLFTAHTSLYALRMRVQGTAPPGAA